jgi:cytochrome c556
MCVAAAIPIAALVISAAGTGYEAYQKNEEVKRTNAFQEKVAEQGAALASANFKNQADQENYRQQQEDMAAAQTKQQNEKEAAKAKSTAAVAAGEAGVAGISVDALQADFNRQEAIFAGAVDTNRGFGRAQSQQQMQALRAGAIDRIVSTQATPLSAPGYYGAALRIGGQAMDTYNTYYRK